LKATWLKTIGEYLKGVFLYGLIDEIYREKRSIDHLFMLGLFGNTIGFPHLFNYYHLKILPYYVMKLEPWKRRVLKERDFFDSIKDD